MAKFSELIQFPKLGIMKKRSIFTIAMVAFAFIFSTSLYADNETTYQTGTEDEVMTQGRDGVDVSNTGDVHGEFVPD